MYFSNIIGQTNVVSSLKSGIENNRVGHAYIFSGPKGIGKKTLARIFAKGLLCNYRISDGGCEDCGPCHQFIIGSNPDYRELNTEEASIKVDDIRSLQSDIAIKPFNSDRKVYLIVDADKMTEQAQNCLLKTMEEPPGYAVIILTTANYDSLLDTVRSRAVKYNFKRNTPEEVGKALKTRLGNEPENVGFIASWADGAIGAAYELALSEEFIQKRNKVLDEIVELLNADVSHIFETYSFFDNNKNDIITLLDLMALFYRDVLMAKKVGNDNILINYDKKDIINDVALRFSTRQLINNIDVIESTKRDLKQNANFQLVIEVMLMKLREDFS